LRLRRLNPSLVGTQ